MCAKAKDKMQKPYYQDSAVTIYHGDCREIVPQLGRFDLLLTDPPYGIGESKKASVRTNSAKPDERWRCRVPTNYEYSEWDSELVDNETIKMLIAASSFQIIFGGNYYQLPPTKCWLVWDKENGANDFADCELAWTNFNKAVRRIKYLWNGFQKARPEERYHPTQKPLSVIKWAMNHAPDSTKTILDPFAGSGTTGRAAKDLNKTAVLIEREERYCEIAASRMSQEVLAL